MASLLILGLSGATKKDTATGNLNNKNLYFYGPCKASFIADLFLFFLVFLYESLVKNNSGVKPAGQCGAWVKEAEGGLFTSPNYPNKYPPNTECVYILEGEYDHDTRNSGNRKKHQVF